MTLHLNKIESDLSTDHRCLEYESYRGGRLKFTYSWGKDEDFPISA